MKALKLFLAFPAVWNMLAWCSSAKVTLPCGPADVLNQTSNFSSVVLLGGLFPLHKFEGQGRENCGQTITKKGFQRSLGMVFAVEQINKNASFLPGIKLAYDIRDSCTSSVTSLEESLTFLPKFSQLQEGTQACSQVELWRGSFGPKWNSLLRKWPLWLITFCWTDNLRFKYLDTSFISGIDGVYR